MWDVMGWPRASRPVRRWSFSSSLSLSVRLGRVGMGVGDYSGVRSFRGYTLHAAHAIPFVLEAASASIGISVSGALDIATWFGLMVQA